jgi:dolichol kinase
MTAPGVPSMRAARDRKLIHLGTAVLPVAWAYGLVDTPVVRWVLAAAVGLAVAVEWGRHSSAWVRARFIRLAGALLKPHEATAFTGATWLAIAMLVAVVVLPEPAARVALWAGAVGDSVAALAGRAWGAWRSAGAEARRGKSIVGSLAGGLATAFGAIWLGAAAVAVALAVGAAAALAEWPRRPWDDNLRVTLVAGGAAWLLGVG